MPQGHLISALDVSSKVNQFGAYAGLAAIVGLGVLSLLYFAQARELKRLRDWAGRAPERAVEPQAAAPAAVVAGQQRLATHPQAQRAAVSPARPATPASPGAPGVVTPAAGPARPAATAPSSAAAAAAVAASRPGASATPGSPPAPGAPATPGSPPAPGAPAVAGGAAVASSPASPASPASSVSQPTVASSAIAPEGTAVAPSPPPPAVRRTTGRTTERASVPLRAPAPGAYAPASARARSDAQRELGVESRSPLKTTLIVVGGVILVAVIVFVLITQVFASKDDNPAPNTIQTTASTTSKTTTAAAKKKAKPGTPTVVRGDTAVTVLNGTQTGGLAMTETNKLKGLGFKTGTPTDAVDQSAQTTYVYFADGKRPAADEVASALGISADSVRALDASTKVLAPGADVVVVVGADQAG